MKKRSEIDEQFKWDLSLIYKTEEEMNGDRDLLDKKVNELVTYKDKIMNNASTLNDVLVLSEEVDRLMYKLYMYYHLKLDEDLGNGENQNEFNKLMSVIVKYDSMTSFITPEILKSENLDSYINDDVLKAFKRNLTTLQKRAKHVLSQSEEKIMSISSSLYSQPSSVYSTLTNSELTFESVNNKKGEEVKVNEAEYSTAIRSNDRVLRENFFKSLLNGYGSFNQTLTALMNGELQTKEVTTATRNYDDYITKAMDSNEVSEVVYNNLIEVVRESLDTNYEYLALRKELLGVDELHLYDTYVSIIDSVDNKYDYETGKNLVKESLKIFGDEYMDALNEALENRWIDVYPNENKRGGAYSSGSYDTVPYMLLNYTDGLDDVFTLTHELGHSMHTYFTNKNQTSQDSHYKIFVAEIASTVNELILLDYMYNNTDDVELKKYLLNYNLDQFRTTVVRQTMFAEFEKDMNDKFFNEKSVSSEYLNERYLELNKDYFGKDVVVDNEIKYEWSRIPHFYYDFYVYQYSTCFCIATYVSEQIINGDKGMLDKYLKFLKSGDSLDPISLVKEMGVDIMDKEPLRKAMNKYQSQLDELKTLLK